MDKFDLHKRICNRMHDTYVSKNKDYGDSFAKGIDTFGYVSALVRISDKWNRICTLLSDGKDGHAEVNDETVYDTCIDAANYFIMLAMELKIRKGENA